MKQSDKSTKDMTSVIAMALEKDTHGKNDSYFHPFYFFIFLIFWLCLNGWSVGNFLLGLLLSFGANVILKRLSIKRLYLKHRYLFFKLFYIVLKDIIFDHVRTIAYILRPKIAAEVLPEFLDIKLEIYSYSALSLLNCFVTISPGAIWVGYNMKEHTASIHLLDKRDEEKFLKHFNESYQKTLLKIFEVEEERAKQRHEMMLETYGI